MNDIQKKQMTDFEKPHTTEKPQATYTADTYDQELEALMEETKTILGETDFTILLLKIKLVFSKLHIKTPSWFIKRCFKKLPEYFSEASCTGLDTKSAFNLLLLLLNTNANINDNLDSKIKLMTRLFNTATSNNIRINEHIDYIKELILNTSKEGQEATTLYCLSICLRLGLSPQEAMKVIYTLHSIPPEYRLNARPQFMGALKSMILANINPALIVIIFQTIAENHGFRNNLYNELETKITFDLPKSKANSDEFITCLIKELKISDFQTPESSPQERSPEEYFNKNDQQILEILSVPYKTAKDLNKGLRDLEKLAIAKMNEWDEVGEGMWIYDNNSQTWYSLGGKTLTQENGAIRHQFLPYDISKISENPYIIHVHPEDLELYIAPPISTLTQPALRDHITKFLSATPSEADFRVITSLKDICCKEIKSRAFFVHSLGITEYSYPQNIEKGEDIYKKLSNCRNKTLTEFDFQDYINKHSYPIDTLHLTGCLIEHMNKMLPEGFKITLYPIGTNLSTNQE